MFSLNLKIAVRNLIRNKAYAVLNIGGLAIALAAFILVGLYVAYEKSYNEQIPDHDRIFLVGRTLADTKTEFTPAPLGRLIKNSFPEVELAGRSRATGFEFPINADKGRVYVSNAMQLDHEAGKILNIWPDTGFVQTKGMGLELYVPDRLYATLFPNAGMHFPMLVYMGPKKAGQAVEIRGLINASDAHLTIKYDVVAMGKDIGFGDQNLMNNNFKTYIKVKSGTDVQALSKKIDKLYKAELVKAGIHGIIKQNADAIFLDPLSKLHLQPTAGNNTNYKIVQALFFLSLFLLLIACVNFTNLTIAQANSRAKEVGIKKVLGVDRKKLVLQFLTEIAIQCTLAMAIALVLAELLLPLFNTLFNVPLVLWKADLNLVLKLSTILLGITLIAGCYPAWVLSGFKPAAILKGNFQMNLRIQWLRNALLVGQFCIAIVFIAGLLVVQYQLQYMQTEDVGFKADQVVHIKNIEFYNQPAQFEAARQQIEKIPGVNHVTVASSIPGDLKTEPYTYQLLEKKAVLNALNVDFDYFETLSINLKEGRFFSKAFKTDSSTSAILNESAVAALQVKDPIGKQIKGCNDALYTIVGVVKDLKAQGFEKTVDPTIYAIKNTCSNSKIQILVNINAKQMPQALAALKAQWPNINKLDGEDFRYNFLNEIYGRLFKQQQQLQAIFLIGSSLTIGIAALGLFAFAAFSTNNKIKEITVRKVLGASNFQLFSLVNTFFMRVVMLANLIAWPIIYVLASKWLDFFAYRIAMPIMPFVLAACITLLLAVLTVAYQVQRVLRLNPSTTLKYE